MPVPPSTSATGGSKGLDEWIQNQHNMLTSPSSRATGNGMADIMRTPDFLKFVQNGTPAQAGVLATPDFTQRMATPDFTQRSFLDDLSGIIEIVLGVLGGLGCAIGAALTIPVTQEAGLAGVAVCIIVGIGLVAVGITDLSRPGVPIKGIASKCIDVAGGATYDGTAIQLYDCNGSNAQKWIKNVGGSLSSIGTCMAVADNATTAGSKIVTKLCNGTNAEKWTVPADGQAGPIVHTQSGQCLDVPWSDTKNGNQLQIWPCTGNANQQWTMG